MGTECRIAIINRWKTNMQRVDLIPPPSANNWDPEPPKTIEPGQIANFVLKSSDAGTNGSVDYSFTYPPDLTATVQFKFSNSAPVISNFVDWLWVLLPTPPFNGTLKFISKAGDDQPWLIDAIRPPGGNLVEAVYLLYGN